MSDERLKAKLRKIVIDSQGITMTHGGEPTANVDRLVAKIDQVYKKEGYRKASPLGQFKADHQMSGAWWYQEFERELKSRIKYLKSDDQLIPLSLALLSARAIAELEDHND